MPRKIALKENGVIVGRLTVPDGATDDEIRNALLRLKAHREKAALDTPRATPGVMDAPLDPLDEEIRCIVCPGRVIVKRRGLETHMVEHRRELEQLRANHGRSPGNGGT